MGLCHMKIRKDIYKKYGLKSIDFDELQFQKEWKIELDNKGFRDIAIAILNEGKKRRFLAEELSSEELAKINDGETIVSAKDAEQFRKKVAMVGIHENNERFVDLRKKREANLGIWTFTDAKYHEACGEWAGKEKLFLVRKSVADKLSILAKNLLKFNIRLRFEDGFRPYGVQEGLFLRRIKMIKATNPEWNRNKLILEAKSKTAYTPRFAAHKAGAAVDVSMLDSTTGKPCNIGQGYPGGGEVVRLNTEFVTQHQWQNRKILECLAKDSGLFMYPYENWHLCYGDTTAAVVSSDRPPYIAKYGPVKNYDPDTGEILETYSPDKLDSIFPVIEEHVK